MVVETTDWYLDSFDRMQKAVRSRKLAKTGQYSIFAMVVPVHSQHKHTIALR